MKVAIYARVSTDRGEQDPQVQVSALKAFLGALGHTVVATYTDEMSGAKKNRPALDLMLKEAPLLVFEAIAIVKLDRLGRSVANLCEIAATLEAQGIDLIVKDQGIDTSTPAGKLMFHVLAAMAEFERDLIAERTVAGMAHAKSLGIHVGRPKIKIDPAAVETAVREHGSKTKAAVALGVSRTVITRGLAEARALAEAA